MQSWARSARNFRRSRSARLRSVLRTPGAVVGSDRVHKRRGVEGQRLDLTHRVDAGRPARVQSACPCGCDLLRLRRCGRVRHLFGCRGSDFVLMYSGAEHGRSLEPHPDEISSSVLVNQPRPQEGRHRALRSAPSPPRGLDTRHLAALPRVNSTRSRPELRYPSIKQTARVHPGLGGIGVAGMRLNKRLGVPVSIHRSLILLGVNTTRWQPHRTACGAIWSSLRAAQRRSEPEGLSQALPAASAPRHDIRPENCCLGSLDARCPGVPQ